MNTLEGTNLRSLNPSSSKWSYGLALMLMLLSLSSGRAQNVIAWGDDSQGQIDVPAVATNVIAVAAGRYHSLALRADGAVVGWGNDGYGASQVPATATNVVAIAAGYYHSLALRADGTVLAWGNNQYGQTNVPASATNIVGIAATYYCSLVLRADGTVQAWGKQGNSYRGGPTNVPASASNVVAVAAGPTQGIALRQDGTGVNWGYDSGTGYDSGVGGTFSPFPYAWRDVLAVSGGTYDDLALKAGGQVTRWSSLSIGKMPEVPALATNVVCIAAGNSNHLALRTDGQVLSWGLNSLTNLPPTATNVLAVAAGYAHCLAATAAGAPPRILSSAIAYHAQAPASTPLPLCVRAVGCSPLHYYWLADGISIEGTDTPNPQIPAVLGTDAVRYQVIVSNAFGCATSAVASLTITPFAAWGCNPDGQCSPPLTLSNAVAVAAGAFHGLALNQDGTVTAWGKNRDGQANVPSTATNVLAVAGGGDHSLALRQDGSVLAWGRDWDGQTDVPAAATNAIAIAAGWAHSLALRGDGTVIAWGNNDTGQTNTAGLPSDFTAIAAGYYHNLGLRVDGSVVTWGWDVPVPVNATNIVAIAAGWEHCLALRADGVVIGWGDNTYGESSVPAEATNVVRLAAGYYQNLALRADGSVLMWGRAYPGVTNVPTGLAGVVDLAAGEDFSLALVRPLAPRVTFQTGSQTVHIGGQTCLSVLVEGGYPLTEQWYHDGVLINGATSGSLRLRNAQPGDAGDYGLMATNSAGQTASQPIHVAVVNTPFIAASGAPQTVPVGANICLTADISGGSPMTYQWRLNGVDLQDGGRINGATSAVLCLTGVGVGDRGTYTLLASNAFGTVSSMVTVLAVNEVLAWGDNASGQCDVPPSATNIVLVSAGEAHNLAVRTDGSVVAWGDNTHHQCDVPALVNSAVAVAAGGAHSLALLADGSVVAWGDNTYGQATVPALPKCVVAIAAGSYHSLALEVDGTIVAWGNNGQGQTTVPSFSSPPVAIAAAGAFSLAQSQDGSATTWGAAPTMPLTLHFVVGVGASGKHAVALRADGLTVGWGTSYYCTNTTPSAWSNVVMIGVTAGDDHNLGLKSGGKLLGWGGDYSGQLSGAATISNAISISGGGAHSLALVAGPTVNTGLVRSVWASPNTVALLAPGSAGGMATNGQWFHDGTLVSGAFAQYLRLASAKATDAGTYQRVTLDAAGRTNVQTLSLVVQTLHAKPSFTGALNVQTAQRGASVLLTAQVQGDLPMQYQWQFSGTNLLNGGRVAGATGTALSLNAVEFADAGYYSLTASNAYGTSNAVVAQLQVPAVIAWGSNSFGETTVPAAASNVVGVAAGGHHSLALQSNNRVVVWGDQSDAPLSAVNVVAVAAGDAFSAALRADGTVVTWGNSASLPKSDLIAIAAGGNHLVGLSGDGSVSGWLGGGTNAPEPGVPVVSDGVAVAAGALHSLALKADGTVVAWGDDSAGQTEVPALATNVMAIAAAGDDSMALRGDGLVLAWGDYGAGQTNVPVVATNALALAASGSHELALLAVGHRAPSIAPTNLVRTVQAGSPLVMSALVSGDLPMSYRWQFGGTNLLDGGRVSGTTSIALKLSAAVLGDAGTYSLVASNAYGSVTTAVMRLVVPSVIAWGANDHGQTSVPSSATNVVAVTAGGRHSLALLSNGRLLPWGETNAVVPYGLSNVIAVAAGDIFDAALQADGTTVTWGGSNNPPASANILAISAEETHLLALTQSGSVLGWYGRASETGVPAMTDAVGIAAGGRHGLAVRANGTVLAWGDNAFGQCDVPPAATNVLVVAAGGSHSLVLRADGSVLAFGDSSAGQLAVPGEATNVVAIAAGGDDSMALRADGQILAWGADAAGLTNVPMAASNAVAIATSGAHSLAVVGSRQPMVFQPLIGLAQAGTPRAFTLLSVNGRATYQWLFNGAVINGATDAVLYLSNPDVTNVGIYNVVVHDTFGSVTSGPLALTVARVLRFDNLPPGLVISNGLFTLEPVGSLGLGQVIIYASSNLADWRAAYTSAPNTNRFYFQDPVTAGQRFYRVLEYVTP